MSPLLESLQQHPSTRRWLSKTLYAGHRVQCPCCAAAFRAFAPFNARPDRVCWQCGALERHRQIALVLRQHPALLVPGLRVLHIAPERPIRGLLEKSQPSEYLTADLKDPAVDLNFDLTAIPLPDRSFDVVMCNHVMEHVPDDRAALREIARVLADSGWALLMTPIVVDVTVEDPSITDPGDRLRAFGQRDHVRRYGWDYVERLREAGLSPEVIRLERVLSSADVHRHRLTNTEGFVEPMFLAHKGASVS
jgi:methyltransferase family protein